MKEIPNFPKENYFDLEDPEDTERLSNPSPAFSPLKGLIVIDEVQRHSDLFLLLRVPVDREGSSNTFLILGSTSKEFMKHSSETLTGRICYFELTPFPLQETGDPERLWYRGGFPGSYLAKTQEDGYQWMKHYIRTFLEQDIPLLDRKVSSDSLRRFWMMLTHYHGNIYNGMEISRSLGISHHYVRQYVDILTSTWMVRQLQPRHENISKRQVKSRKIYFRDTGILHTLLGIKDLSELLRHPKPGVSWEGFAPEEVIRYHKADPYECYFWCTQSHAEPDLLLIKDGEKKGFEFKYGDAPKLTKSMVIAMQDLKLDELTVIYPGVKSYFLQEKIRVISLKDYILR